MWEERQTKEIITKETCKRELLREHRATIWLRIVFAILSVLMSLLAIPAADLFLSSLELISEWGVPALVYVGAMLLVTLVFAAFGVLGIGIIIYALWCIKEINGARFEIVEDHLVSMVKDEPVRRFGDRHTHYDDVFYFARTGRYVVTVVDKSAWDYSSEDDKFYVVIMGKGKKPVRVYNARVYEYKK